MTMLAEVVDAVIGIDTHRDTHEAEIADTAGRPIATMQVSNDSAGFARLLAGIAEVVPGSRVAVCIEGTRSYGIGLTRALAAAGLLVIECERPSRKRHRGKGKSDPIDAHLAVLAALRLDAGKLPVPRWSSASAIWPAPPTYSPTPTARIRSRMSGSSTTAARRCCSLSVRSRLMTMRSNTPSTSHSSGRSWSEGRN